MSYEIRQVEGGWALTKLRPVLVGTFPEESTAALVRDLLAAADENETGEVQPKPASGGLVIGVPSEISPLLGAPSFPEPTPAAPRPAAEPAPALLPTWKELFERGLTVIDAAEIKQSTKASGYAWASKAGVKWPSLRAEVEPAAAAPAPRPAPAAPVTTTASRAGAAISTWTPEELEEALGRIEAGEKPSAVADDYRKPAHVLTAALSRRLAARREAAGRPLVTTGATARDDAEAGL